MSQDLSIKFPRETIYLDTDLALRPLSRLGEHLVLSSSLILLLSFQWLKPQEYHHFLLSCASPVLPLWSCLVCLQSVPCSAFLLCQRRVMCGRKESRVGVLAFLTTCCCLCPVIYFPCCPLGKDGGGRSSSNGFIKLVWRQNKIWRCFSKFVENWTTSKFIVA